MRILFILCLLLCLPMQALAAQAKKEPVLIELQTTKGNVTIELDTEKAPNTAANFKRYVEEGFYDGTIFHRVIPGFMIQGGGMTPDMKEKPTHDPIKNEANNGLPNLKYTVAMARTQDPHSATAQFFINAKDNDFLNFKSESVAGWGYCVFGKVIKGTDVVDAIEKVKTGSKGWHDDVPVDPVIITKAVVVKK